MQTFYEFYSVEVMNINGIHIECQRVIYMEFQLLVMNLQYANTAEGIEFLSRIENKG